MACWFWWLVDVFDGLLTCLSCDDCWLVPTLYVYIVGLFLRVIPHHFTHSQCRQVFSPLNIITSLTLSAVSNRLWVPKLPDTSVSCLFHYLSPIHLCTHSVHLPPLGITCPGTSAGLFSLCNHTLWFLLPISLPLPSDQKPVSRTLVFVLFSLSKDSIKYKGVAVVPL